MQLSEFISNVLSDIEEGLKGAQKITGKGYFVDTGNERGVRFDIAVTTSDITGSSIEGTASADAKVGIQVLGGDIGADIGAKQEEKKENNQISRIQFLVVVPIGTKEEESEALRRLAGGSPPPSLNF